MARKLRIEYAGAKYHVINRGNYRDDVFADERTKQAFLDCLGEAAAKSGWVIHAYVLMSNHYHLALETPSGNLVEGMRWLQSTFANRFNRFRGERGHVFQGRYKALLVEPEGLGPLAHYIHLNPVRAGIVSLQKLADYAPSSYACLLQPKERPAWLVVTEFLTAAGDLADTPTGRRKYAEYLGWLMENEPARKQLKFEQMSTGWALGGETFKAHLVKHHRAQLEKTGQLDASTKEARQLIWSDILGKIITRLRKTSEHIAADTKSAPWKIAIAAHLKTTTTVTNPWLSSALNMGAPEGVSRYVTELRTGKRPEATEVLAKISNIKV